jgi:hypothetical protein
MYTYEFKKCFLLFASIMMFSSGCQMQKNGNDETMTPYVVGEDQNMTPECRMTGAPMAPMAYKALQDKCFKSNKIENKKTPNQTNYQQ